jgi:hypothetical protein
MNDNRRADVKYTNVKIGRLSAAFSIAKKSESFHVSPLFQSHDQIGTTA